MQIWVVQLLKSWEYKNEQLLSFFHFVLYSYLNLESTKTSSSDDVIMVMLYSYLNLESTKTSF